MLSSAASAEEECSDSIPPERGERAQAPFRRPEVMISGPQERSSLVYVQRGFSEGSREQSRDSEERKRENVRGHRKEVKKKTENYTGRPVRVEGESSEDFAQFKHKTAEALPHLVLDSKGTRVRIGGVSAREG